MIINHYDAPPAETAAERYERDYKRIPLLDTDGNPDDRHTRMLLEQTVERKSRRYVDDGISAVTGGSPVFDSTTPGDSTPVDPGDNGGGTPLPEGTVWSDNFSEETLGELWSQLIGAPLKTNPLRSADGRQAMIASEPTLANRIETEAFFGQDEVVRALGISINSEQGAPIASISVESGGSIVVQSNSGQDNLILGDLTDKKAKVSVEFDQDAIRVFVDSALALTHADDSIPDGPYILALSIEGNIEVLYFRAILNNGGGTPEPEPETPEEPSEPEVPEGSYQENYTEAY